MIVSCASCSSRFRIADEKVPATGVKVRCARCGAVFLARREVQLPPLDEPSIHDMETKVTRLSPELLAQLRPEHETRVGAPAATDLDLVRPDLATKVGAPASSDLDMVRPELATRIGSPGRPVLELAGLGGRTQVGAPDPSDLALSRPDDATRIGAPTETTLDLMRKELATQVAAPPFFQDPWGTAGPELPELTEGPDDVDDLPEVSAGPALEIPTGLTHFGSPGPRHFGPDVSPGPGAQHFGSPGPGHFGPDLSPGPGAPHFAGGRAVPEFSPGPAFPHFGDEPALPDLSGPDPFTIEPEPALPPPLPARRTGAEELQPPRSDPAFSFGDFVLADDGESGLQLANERTVPPVELPPPSWPERPEPKVHLTPLPIAMTPPPAPAPIGRISPTPTRRKETGPAAGGRRGLSGIAALLVALAAFVLVRTGGDLGKESLLAAFGLGEGAGPVPALAVDHVTTGLYPTEGGRSVPFARGVVVSRDGAGPAVKVVGELRDRAGVVIGRAEGWAGGEPTPEEVHGLSSPASWDALASRVAAESAGPIPKGGQAPFLLVFVTPSEPGAVHDLRVHVVASPGEKPAPPSPRVAEEL